MPLSDAHPRDPRPLRCSPIALLEGRSVQRLARHACFLVSDCDIRILRAVVRVEVGEPVFVHVPRVSADLVRRRSGLHEIPSTLFQGLLHQLTLEVVRHEMDLASYPGGRGPTDGPRPGTNPAPRRPAEARVDGFAGRVRPLGLAGEYANPPPVEDQGWRRPPFASAPLRFERTVAALDAGSNRFPPSRSVDPNVTAGIPYRDPRSTLDPCAGRRRSRIHSGQDLPTRAGPSRTPAALNRDGAIATGQSQKLLPLRVDHRR